MNKVHLWRLAWDFPHRTLTTLDNFLRITDNTYMSLKVCIVCLAKKADTNHVYSHSNIVRPEITLLLNHLRIQFQGTPENSGLCSDCMEKLQQWHMFSTTRNRQHDKLNTQTIEQQPLIEMAVENTKITFKSISRLQWKLAEVREIMLESSFNHCILKNWSEEDLEFLCYHLVNSYSVNAPMMISLERYLTSKEKLLKFFCIMCSELIPDGKTGYEVHVANFHPEIKIVVYPCDICEHMAPDRDNQLQMDGYFTHWLKHFYFFTCNECTASFSTNADWLSHKETHHKTDMNDQVEDDCLLFPFDPQPMMWQAPVDSQYDDDYEVMDAQKRIQEREALLLKCDICDEMVNRTLINIHKMHHSLYTFSTSAGAISINKGNPKLEPKKSPKKKRVQKLTGFQCHLCKKNFIRKDYFTNHMNAHKNIYNFKCKKCNRVFTSMINLKAHMRSHSPKKIQPEIENIFAGVVDSLCLKLGAQEAKKQPDLALAPKMYRCGICKKNFKFEKSFMKHVELHKQKKIPPPPPVFGLNF